VLYHISHHARAELIRRQIRAEVVADVLANPEQRVQERDNITCYQSRIQMAQSLYLIRVFVDETKSPPTVVTVYRTSRIAKYWSFE
jgi:hypothetical protein